jgi:teichuronic acid biosynthesis glycosyltransferase TuaG
MKDLFISICIPVYNVGNFIGETLESIKNQSYTNWELIIVDDGSDDGAQKSIETFRNSVEQKVKYFKNEFNKGPSATRNAAVSFAKGDWFAFLDGDDIWHKDHLKHLINTVIAKPDCDLIYSDLIYFFDDIKQPLSGGIRIVSDKNLEEFPISLYKQDFFIQPSTMMVSRKLYSTVNGFDENYRFAEDFKFNLKCLDKEFKFAYTNESTCYHRKHPDGFSTNYFKMIYGHAKVFDETISWNLKGIPQRLRYENAAKYWLFTARIAKVSDLELSKTSINKALKYNFNFKTLLHFFIIYLYPLINIRKTTVLVNK